MKEQPEYILQAGFVAAMGYKYPKVIIFSDCAAHIKKTIRQQQRANKLQSREKQPDLFIARPQSCGGGYAGFYMEMKANTPFKKDGVTLLKNDHIYAQARSMAKLEEAGYCCQFVWSVEQGLKLYEQYEQGDILPLIFEIET